MPLALDTELDHLLATLVAPASEFETVDLVYTAGGLEERPHDCPSVPMMHDLIDCVGGW